MNSRRFDRLSSLPESLVIGILSCLELREAVATCVLSKQWRFVWANLPRLELKETTPESKLVDFVHRMIAVEWPFLRSLSLCRLRMSQENLENLVSRCPLLESLELRKCRGFYCVDVGNPSVRRLCVENLGQNLDELNRISVPYIRELEVCGVPVRVYHALNLDQATIRIGHYNDRPFARMTDTLRLLGDIRHVNKLDFRGGTAVLISWMAEYRGFEFQQFRLQSLAICAPNEFHIYGIIALLRSSPNLHNLLISYLDLDFRTRIEIEGTLDCDELLHLKFVAIAFIDSTTVKLAQIILEKAPSLEEMVIRKSRNSRDFIEKCQPLLLYPRSSQKAKLLILQ